MRVLNLKLTKCSNLCSFVRRPQFFRVYTVAKAC